MEFSKLIKDRFSTRDFDGEPLTCLEIKNITKAVLPVPTSRNKQTQRIKIIIQEEGLRKIDACTPCRFNASAVIIIGYSRKASAPSNNIETGIIDASITTTYLMLNAFNLGIDSVWVGNFNYEELVKQFNIDNDIVPIALLMLGHRTKTYIPSKTHYERNEFETFFF